MKKIKSILCIALLSIFLVGNVFAGNTVGNDVFSFFGRMADAVYSLVLGRYDCRPRDCQNCRPELRDSDGNCRPIDN